MSNKLYQPIRFMLNFVVFGGGVVAIILWMVTSLMAADSSTCNKDLSTENECWYNCKTEDEITICDIILCPEGLNCGFDESEGSDQITISVPSPDTTGPRVGEYINKYVKDRQARGRVSTRVYRTVGADSLHKKELLIFIKPQIVE